MPIYHHPTAMPREAVDILNCRPGKVYVDGTLGGSGHAKSICGRLDPGGILVGIDQDRDALVNAQAVLRSCPCNVHLIHDNFQNLPAILSQLHIPAVDGILLDLGISLHHLEASGRGFSFNRNEPLDMRMDTDSSTTAEDLINRSSAKELADIFRTYGEERRARKIAGAIEAARRREPVRTSLQLAQIVAGAVGHKSTGSKRIHPATKVFMALRIVVNRELDVLDSFLDGVIDCLNPSGRLCILSFHSLADRMVKQRMKSWADPCTCPRDFPVCACGKKPMVQLLTPRVMRPTQEEVAQNPLARSTRLRAIEKL